MRKLNVNRWWIPFSSEWNNQCWLCICDLLLVNRVSFTARKWNSEEQKIHLMCCHSKADMAILKFDSLVLERKRPLLFTPEDNNGRGAELNWRNKARGARPTWLNGGANTDRIPSAAFWRRHKHHRMNLSHPSAFIRVLFGFKSKERQINKTDPLLSFFPPFLFLSD